MSVEKHPGPKQYIIVGLVLAVITIVEVAYPYMTEGIESLNKLYMPVLGLFALTKFVLVAVYYMHLKNDNSLLTGIFVFALFLTAMFITAFLFLF